VKDLLISQNRSNGINRAISHAPRTLSTFLLCYLSADWSQTILLPATPEPVSKKTCGKLRSRSAEWSSDGRRALVFWDAALTAHDAVQKLGPSANPQGAVCNRYIFNGLGE